MAECHLPKVIVEGSIPFSRSILLRYVCNGNLRFNEKLVVLLPCSMILFTLYQGDSYK